MTHSIETNLPGGVPRESEDPRAVVTECDLPEAPEKVWKALTQPALLRKWLPDLVEGEILAAEPNRLLRYRWPVNDLDEKGRTLDSVVTFELAGTPAGGTHLRVVHRVFATATLIPFGRRGRGETVALLGGGARVITTLLRWAA